jgi:hypothetical protein
MVTDSNDCVSFDTFDVVKSDLSFDAFAITDTITCDQPLAILKGFSDSTNVTFTWEGPNGFIGSGPVIQVSDSGQYILTVTYDSICSTTDTIVVPKEDGVPDIYIIGDTINCIKDSARLVGGSSTAGSSLSWTGPNGFLDINEIITVGDSGTYTLKVLGLNGCEIEKTFRVIIDRQIPSITTLFTDTLNCIRDSVSLNAQGLNASLQWKWSGPNGFSSSNNSPNVGKAGIYFIEVTGQNGCSVLDSVQVLSDMAVPQVSGGEDTLNCLKSVVTLSVGSVNNAVWTWTGPNGFLSNEVNPQVSNAGSYSVNIIGANGCDTSVTVTISIDTVAPIFSLTSDTLNCQTPVVPIDVQTSDLGVYSWQGPNNFSSNNPEPMVRDSGWYVLTLTATNGCSATDSIFVHQTEATPDISAFGDTINCLKDSVILYGNSTSPNVTYNWSDSTGILDNTAQLTVYNAGTYTFTVRTLAGCESELIVEVVADTASPKITNIASLGLKCDSLFTNLISDFDSTVTNLIWTGPGGFTSTDQNPRVSDIGWYFLTVYSENGCMGTDSVFLVAQDMKPDISVIGDTLTCLTDTIDLIGASSTSNVTYSWQGPLGFFSTDPIVQTSQTGTYIFTVRDQNDCTSEVTIEVTEDLSRPTSVVTVDTIHCKEIPADISAQVNPPNSVLNWSGPMGMLGNSAQITTSQPGIYNLISIHPKTGCADTTSAEVVQDDDTITNVVIQTADIDCDSEFGSIEILSVEGSRGPYQYSINGGNFSPTPTFDQLISGMYDVLVMDVHGCVYLRSVFIDKQSSYQISAPSTLQINSGASTTINVVTTIPDSLIAQISWTPATDLSCVDCLNPVANPMTTTTYMVTVIDKNGCVYTADIIIEVDVKQNVYIPNAFNDILFVYGDDSIIVDQFLIFDRWGEIIFSSEGGTANDPSYGWNGTFHGENVLPGVYVYFIIISTAEGQKQISGSVTVVD